MTEDFTFSPAAEPGKRFGMEEPTHQHEFVPDGQGGYACPKCGYDRPDMRVPAKAGA